jgi:serine/threonine protein phosphatase PrpC
MLYFLATRINDGGSLLTDETSNQTHVSWILWSCALLFIILCVLAFFLSQKGTFNFNTIGNFFKFIKMETLFKSASKAYKQGKYFEARNLLQRINLTNVPSELRLKIEQLANQVNEACSQKERNDGNAKITEAINSESYADASKLCDEYKTILTKENITAYQAKIASSFFTRLSSILSEERFEQAVNELYDLLSINLASLYSNHVQELYNAIHSSIDDTKSDETITKLGAIIYSEKIKLVFDKDSLTVLKRKICSRYKTIINSLISEEKFADARSRLSKYQSRLSEEDVITLKGKITSAEADKEKRINELINSFKQNVDSGKIEEASKLLSEIEKSNGEQAILRKYKKKKEDNLAEEKRQIDFTEAISRAIQHIDQDRFKEAEDELVFAKQLYEMRVLPEILKKQLEEYNERKQLYNNRKADEAKMFGSQSLLLIEPTINVAKKLNAGEDSDPYVNFDVNRNWGVLGVFDGLGGAGARKYIHNQTNEEHTSAYWASRIVRGAVDSYLKRRPLGKDSFKYLEEGLHVAICDELNARIECFPQAQLPLPSKMMAKLPTTMVLSHYKTSNDTVRIRCLWAGDSRAYLLTKESMFYLTVDDTDANDMDPFSPENMDMAMTNKISQDKSFHINVSDITVSTTEMGPMALIVASDGCFDYYRNPLAFEIMLRECLKKSDSESNWSSEITKAIIENIQQDDFSMAVVAFGTNSFISLKESLVPVLHNELYSSYSEWENTLATRVESIQNRIQQQTQYITDLVSDSEEKNCRLNNYHEKEAEHVSYLSKNEEFASRYSIILPSIESDSFLQSLRKAIEVLDHELETIKVTLVKARDDLKQSQIELEKEQLAINEENIAWYHKYKEGITVLPISNQI